MGRRTPVSAPPNLKNAQPRQFHDESIFEWMRRQNGGRAATKTATKEKAPCKSGNSAEGNDRNPTKGTIVKNNTSVTRTTVKDSNDTPRTVTGPSGRTIDPDSLTMRIICNADMHRAGTIAHRANYIISASR